VMECYSALAKCELFLGEKLHACAMAAVAGVPFVSLEYQPKVRDFAASVGMESFTISTAETDASVYVDQVRQLATEGIQARRKLNAAVEQLRGKLANFAAGYGACGSFSARSSSRSSSPAAQSD